MLPEFDPVLVEKGNKQSLLSALDQGLTGKLPMQPTPIDPFAFDNFNWTNLYAEGNASTPSPTAFRLWAKYFSSRDPGLPFVTIPAEWMDFFTLLLLKDSSNEWATQFLKSLA